MTTNPGAGWTRVVGWLAAAAAIVLTVISAVGFAETFASGPGSSAAAAQGPATQSAGQLPGADPTPTSPALPTLPTPGATQTPRPTPSGTTPSSSPRPGGPGPSPTGRPPASPPAGPGPQPVPTPTSISSLFPWVGIDTQHQQTGKIDFTLTNLSFNATGQVVVVLTLPSGTQVSGGSPGQQISAGGGWTCAVNSDGATCWHSGISSFDQAEGKLSFAITNTAACLQSVQMGGAVKSSAIIFC